MLLNLPEVAGLLEQVHREDMPGGVDAHLAQAHALSNTQPYLLETASNQRVVLTGSAKSVTGEYSFLGGRLWAEKGVFVDVFRVMCRL